jgi:hypothetical protein
METLSMNNFDEKYINPSKKELFKVLEEVNIKTMNSYCKKIIEINYGDYTNEESINKEIELFQTAFIEMESLFINKPRKQEGKS